MEREKGRRARGRQPLVHHGEVLSCTWELEKQARAEGFLSVGGADEVGRGALCGPVVAAVVLLGEGFDADGLDDSKRLTPLQRAACAQRIREGARAWALGCVEPRDVDRLNVLRATHLAVQRALEALAELPDLLLLDALTVPGVSLAQRAIIKGDARSVSIAAASIVAKVARDDMMQEWDRRYPGYGLAVNMGYASADHRDALRRLGPSDIHRRSFHGTQRWLFT